MIPLILLFLVYGIQCARYHNYEHTGDFCAHEHERYEYYCKGIWTAEKIRQTHSLRHKIAKFCGEYKAECITRGRGGKVYNRDEQEERKEHKKTLTDDVGELAFDDLMRKLEKIVPCRPNCNVSIHPHCTRQCKCEYEYDRMEKWCSPPQNEHYKYFCRIWSMSCSPYLPDLMPYN